MAGSIPILGPIFQQVAGSGLGGKAGSLLSTLSGAGAPLTNPNDTQNPTDKQSKIGDVLGSVAKVGSGLSTPVSIPAPFPKDGMSPSSMNMGAPDPFSIGSGINWRTPQGQQLLQLLMPLQNSTGMSGQS